MPLTDYKPLQNKQAKALELGSFPYLHGGIWDIWRSLMLRLRRLKTMGIWPPFFSKRRQKRFKATKVRGIDRSVRSGKLTLDMGENASVHHDLMVVVRTQSPRIPSLKIGKHVEIGENQSIHIGSVVEIGDHVKIDGHGCLLGFAGRAENYLARSEGLTDLNSQALPIRIRDHVWIARNVLIEAGVTIGEGAIIKPGSVVMTDIPAFSVAAGVPARVIKTLPFAKKSQEAPQEETIHKNKPQADHAVTYLFPDKSQ